MKNLKIGKQLILSFVIVAFMASIAGIVGLFVSRITDKNYSQALVTNGFSQGDIGRFNTYLNKGSALVRDIIFLTGEQEIQSAQQELTGLSDKLTDALSDLKATCQTPEELEQIAIIDRDLPKYREVREQVTALGLRNKNEEALELFRSTARPLLNSCMDAAEALMEMNTTMGRQASARLTNQSNLSAAVILVTILVSLAVSIGFGIIIARSISRPVKEMEAAAREMAAGNLKADITYRSKSELGNLAGSMRSLIKSFRGIIDDMAYGLKGLGDGDFTIDSRARELYVGEFRQLADSMYHIIDKLNLAMGQINQAADQVAAGGDQVAAGAQALSQGATEQAASVEELAATINEISSQVQANAQSARQGSEMAKEAGTQMEEGNRQMQEVIVAMGEISDKSGQIGKIIKTIEDIAFQTNILALNAAVEAARAGAAGKGFAVVADEVRSLAGKSAEASQSTAALIEGSIQAMEKGARLADETARTFSRVVESTRQVTTVVDNISQASGEQAASIAQVTQGIDQISSVVQTNSATAEESAAASEELSGQAQMLKSLVGQFKLKDAGQTRIPAARPRQQEDALPLIPESGKY